MQFQEALRDVKRACQLAEGDSFGQMLAQVVAGGIDQAPATAQVDGRAAFDQFWERRRAAARKSGAAGLSNRSSAECDLAKVRKAPAAMRRSDS